MTADAPPPRPGQETGRFANLLAVCDGGPGDEATVRLAADIARGGGARLTLLGLVDGTGDVGRLSRYAKVDRGEIEARLTAERRAALEGAAARLAGDITTEIDMRIGKPFLEIIHNVIAHDRDLVIKAAEPWAGAPRSLFTSTDQHLLRKCPAPVWLHMPERRCPARTVLAAVDVDLDAAAEPATQDGLNRTTLRTAALIARLEGAKLHVLHAWNAPGESMVRMWSNAPDPRAEADAYVRNVADQSRRGLDRLTADLPGPAFAVTRHAKQGAPRDVIPEQIDALGADLLVMGSVARTGIPGLIIGNTAEDVLNRIECSVVIVKPPGYVSPVRT